MMGFPLGWVDVDGVKRTAQLRMLGNSVQVQVGAVVGEVARALILSAPCGKVRGG